MYGQVPAFQKSTLNEDNDMTQQESRQKRNILSVGITSDKSNLIGPYLFILSVEYLITAQT